MPNPNHDPNDSNDANDTGTRPRVPFTPAGVRAALGSQSRKVLGELAADLEADFRSGVLSRFILTPAQRSQLAALSSKAHSDIVKALRIAAVRKYRVDFGIVTDAGDTDARSSGEITWDIDIDPKIIHIHLHGSCNWGG